MPGVPESTAASAGTRPPPGRGRRSTRPGGVPLAALVDMRVLILDDDEDNVVLLERLLRTTGFVDVVTATDATAAVEGMVSDPPDLLLLDLHMPRLDGFDVLERLARHISGPTPLPVLVLTADMAPEVKRRALAAGARDFLTKPYDLLEVLLRVQGLLESRYLHQRLHEHNLLLEDIDQRRTDDLRTIAADLAHELRTPLYSIRGMVEVMLLESRLDQATARDVRVIDEVARSALEVVDRQIAVARAAAAPSPLDLGLVPVTELLAGLEQMMAPLARAQRITLRVDRPDAVPDLHTDGVLLAQILRNLTANAIRHTHVGGVHLSAHLTTSATHVAFEVTDTGIGVHPADQQRIFEPYERAADHPQDAPGGLGLALARRLARTLGGDVSVISTPGSGSTFTALIARGTPSLTGVPKVR